MNVKLHLFIVIQLQCQCSTFGGRGKLLAKSMSPWLTSKTVTAISDYSFPESRCCNVYINSKLSQTENEVFKWFVSAYRNKYLLRKRVYDCKDHLLIASQDLQIMKSIKSIPVTASDTRILVLLDSVLEEKSCLFNVSMYKNSNVNLISRNGIFVLSENYLAPRIFRKIISLQDLKKTVGHVNLRARELQVSAFFSPPLCFLRTVINKTINGIAARVFSPNKKREIDGIELHLFLIIAKALNFTFTIRMPSGRYNHGRKYNDSAWDGGMIGQIVRNEVDLAFSGIWINHENYEFANLTEPWSQIFVQFLVPRPEAYTSFWALTRPLSPTVWLVLVLVLGLASVYVCSKAWIDPLVPRRFRSLIVALTELMGRMLGTWLSEITPRLRLQFVLWELAGFVVVTAYCSSLAARLANPEYERRIDTVRQFVERNLTWGREGTPPNFKEYFDLEDEYAKRMPGRFVLEKSAEDRIRRILQGDHAVVGKIVGNVYYPENYVSGEALKKLRVMRETVSQFYTGFSVQSWLLEPVNKVMMRLKESGIVLYHMQDVIHRRTGINLREVFVEYDKLDFDRKITLAVNPLGVGFATLIFGLLVACLIFFLELRTRNKKIKLFKMITM